MYRNYLDQAKAIEKTIREIRNAKTPEEKELLQYKLQALKIDRNTAPREDYAIWDAMVNRPKMK